MTRVQSSLTLAACFVTAAVLTALITRMVRDWAVQRGLVDVPDGGRRKHHRAVPRLGGMAVVVGTALTIATVVGVGNLDPAPIRYGPILFGVAAIFLLGVIDDIRGLSPRTKLTVEACVAFLVAVGGVRMYG